MRRNQCRVVSFSGIDGAGKTTQIEALCRFLNERGLRWRLYTFWDDVAAFSRIREKCSFHLFKGDKGIGSPDRPIKRRDKNVTTWPVVLFRLAIYVADAFSARRTFREATSETADVVIFDRYIYDEWANLPHQSWAVSTYIRFLLHLVPKPDIAILLDADPMAAHCRKPEYPLEFVRKNREAYVSVARAVGMTVVPAGSVEDTTEFVTKALWASVQGKTKLPISSEGCRRAPEPNRSGAAW
jgi:thymidylate kinase